MNVNIFYDHYLNEENQQIIKSIKASLDGDIGLDLLVDRTIIDDDGKETPVCRINMYDKIGVSDIESRIDKNELRELIALLRKIYNQL